MKNIKIYAALVVVSSIVIIGLFLSSTNLPQLPHTSVETTARELHIGTDQVIETDDLGNIYFSNGRYFVQLDASSGATKRLSRDVTLPTVSQILISPKSQYIAFQTLATTFDDSLNTQVELTGYNPANPQWWLLDSTTGEYILLPTGAKHAAWDNKDRLHLLYSNQMLVFDSRAVRQEKISVKEAVTFQISDSNYIVQTTEGAVVKLDAGGKELDKLGSKYENVYLSPQTGQYISYKLDGEEFNAAIHLKDAAYHLTDFKELAFAWNGAGDRLGYADSDGLHMVDIRGVAIKDYKLTNGKVDRVRELLVLGVDDLLLRTEDDRVYVTGSSVATKLVQNTVLRIGAYELQGFADGNRFIVTKEGAYTPQDRAAIYSELVKLGYNPDLLRIYFEEISLPEHPL